MFYRVTDDGVQTRAHLEAQLASSLALKSPNEYRQCLLSYIRFLARFSSDPFAFQFSADACINDANEHLIE